MAVARSDHPERFQSDKQGPMVIWRELGVRHLTA